MTRTIVFIHGAWVTPACWESFVPSKAYAKSTARTDFREFPKRTHWIIAQPGWEEVAEHAAGWLDGLGLGAGGG